MIKSAEIQRPYPLGHGGRLATFCSMGTLVRRRKTWRYSAQKVMEFGQLMIDILVNVSCKVEMYIFKIAQVINENVRIAFLYVLSICYRKNLISIGRDAKRFLNRQ